MSYCPNCGIKLIAGSNFCGGCGTKLGSIQLSQESGFRKEYAQKMFKNTVQSIAGDPKSMAKNAMTEALGKSTAGLSQSATPSFGSSAASTSKKNKKTSSTQSRKGGVDLYTVNYFILNTLIYGFMHEEEGVIIPLYVSPIILLIVFIRMNSSKPYNWLVKIFLVIQLLLLLFVILGYWFVLDFELLNIIYTIPLVLLFLLALRLLFRGNG